MIEWVNGSGFFFFFNDTATTEIYTLSLHDALPISSASAAGAVPGSRRVAARPRVAAARLNVLKSRSAGLRVWVDRKSTRLNSSHGYNSYAVFCLKKKN